MPLPVSLSHNDITATVQSRQAISVNMPPDPASGAKKDGSKNNERNEYIPSFIAKKPFYIDDSTVSSDADYLEHQRLQNDSQRTKDSLAAAQWYDRGSKRGPAATKYRKGACENCGSMSHKEKDCLQRKRKKGARWTGKDIQADEVVGKVELGWDAKRDRWNGFDASEYKEVVEDYEAVEAIRRQVAKKGNADEEEGEEGEGEGGGEDGDKYEAETDMGRKQATSTRNLRLREDTAKYLVNLDLESTKYDPKTRRMLHPGGGDPNSLDADDGFAGKQSGDAAEFEKAATYAWETQERGDKDKIHIQANPTQAQLTRKRKAEEEVQKAEAKKKLLAEKYGVQDASTSEKTAQLAATGVMSNERFVEYDERGRVKGEADKKEKSMYPEDVHLNNHTSVFGSWWKDGQWGYRCCHNVVKNSFCTGEEGKRAHEESEHFSRGLMIEAATIEADGETAAAADEAQGEKHVPMGALDRSDEKQTKDESRRRMDELTGGGVTEAEMEQYRREKTNANDPMAKMLGKDELLGL
jgi:pre-mRNA-processing factor SLU7